MNDNFVDYTCRFHPEWDKGRHYPDNILLFIEKQKSRTKSGRLRPKKRIFKIYHVRPGTDNGTLLDGKPDRRQWVTCVIPKRTKGRDISYRFQLDRFRELFVPMVEVMANEAGPPTWFDAKVGSFASTLVRIKGSGYRLSRMTRWCDTYFYIGESVEFVTEKDVGGMSKSMTPKWRTGAIWDIQNNRLFIT